jgi:phosphatidylserine decarboxylase
VISKYGINVAVVFFLIGIVIVICAAVTVGSGVLRTGIDLAVVGVLVLVVNFFRDPERKTPDGQQLVISPADGKIVVIKELFEPEYLHTDAVQVSIFMSPLNVHVNRFPISGVVGYFHYYPGEHTVAFEEKSSERNERTHIGIQDGGYKVLFKQIAGTVARRIISEVAPGQKATKGERFGMIRFGSRLDVIMPRETELRVKLHDRVRAGETVLASYGGGGMHG